MKTTISIAFAILVASGAWSDLWAADDPKQLGQNLDLAAAYVLEGMFEEARPLLDSFPDKLKKPPGDAARGYSPEAATARRFAFKWTF